MINKAKLHLKENVTYQVFDKNGNPKKIFKENAIWKFLNKSFSIDIQIPFLTGIWDYSKTLSNLIPTAGKAGVASRINGDGSEAAFTYLAVGIGTDAAAAGDTALGSEIVDSGLERAAATCSRVQTDVANDTAQLVKSWSVTGTKAVTECGALNAAADGTLLGRQVFSAINVVSGDTLQITYKFDVD
jgi:hypothetical protein